MNFIRRHWYDLGLGLALITLTLQAFLRIEGLQLILLLNLVVLFVHQFEEYHWPGGFPWMMDEGIRRGREGSGDVHLLNQTNVSFINIMACPFYFLPVLFPGAIWLALVHVLFGLVGQVIFH